MDRSLSAGARGESCGGQKSGASFRRRQAVWADTVHLVKQVSGVSDSKAWSGSVT